MPYFSILYVFCFINAKLYLLGTIILEVILGFDLGMTHNQQYSRFSGHFTNSHVSLA